MTQLPVRNAEPGLAGPLSAERHARPVALRRFEFAPEPALELCIVQCPHCGLVYVGNPPSKGARSCEARTRESRRRVRAAAVGAFSQRPSRPVTIADIQSGAAQGAPARAARRMACSRGILCAPPAHSPRSTPTTSSTIAPTATNVGLGHFRYAR